MKKLSFAIGPSIARSIGVKECDITYHKLLRPAVLKLDHLLQDPLGSHAAAWPFPVMSRSWQSPGRLGKR